MKAEAFEHLIKPMAPPCGERERERERETHLVVQWRTVSGGGGGGGGSVAVDGNHGRRRGRHWAAGAGRPVSGRVRRRRTYLRLTGARTATRLHLQRRNLPRLPD